MAGLTRRHALLGAAGVALAGCTPTPTETPTPPPPTSPSPTPTQPTTPPADTRPRWPLTGKLLKDPKAAKHAAVAVKVPDNRNEHPQRGIASADIVFVELDGYRDPAGYSGTRLVPVFHSSMPEGGVGPVRSIRPVDVPLLSPMNAVIGSTGGAPWVINYVTHHAKYLSGAWDFQASKGKGVYTIDRSRVRVYQGQTYYDRAVVCRPAPLGALVREFAAGPTSLYLPFATGDAEPSTVNGQPATTVSVPWQRANTYNMSYAYDKATKRYLRSMPWGPHVTTEGIRVAPDNVLVIRAKQRYAKIFAGTGHDEPIHDIIDTKGTFIYANRGRYVTGVWAKGAIQEPFQFTLADGSPLVMAPGQTYVELPDANAKVVIKG